MAKKRKLPKRIAGMKIPRGIRKGPVGQFLSSSGGQLLMAEALLAAGGLYAARRLEPSTPAGEALRHPIDSLRAKLGSDGEGGSARFARAVRAGVSAFRDTLNESSPDGAPTPEPVYDPRTDTPGFSIDGDPTAKKPSYSRAETSLRETGSGTH